MTTQIGSKQYSYIVGSDVGRDGIYLELNDVTDRTETILEIFCSDQTNEMTLSAFREYVPIEAVEWAIQQAKIRLPPTRK
jgi:hypothetical protein